MKVASLLSLFVVISIQVRAETAPVPTTLSTGSELAVWSITAQKEAHKTPVIFLHGGPGLYTEQRRMDDGEAFRAAGFNTLYFDQAGGGLSKRLPASQYTVMRAVDDLEALRVKQGHQQIILWGNSWGASLATLYTNRFPDRVAALVLTAPGAFPGTRPKRNYDATNRGKVVLGKDVSRAISVIDKQGASAEKSLSQERAGQLFDTVIEAELIEAMVCKSAKVKAPTLSGGGNFFANRLIQKDLKTFVFTPVKQPKRPILIIRGECDFLQQDNATKYGTYFDATVTVITGAGHGLMEERDLVQKALQDFANGPLSNIK